MRNQVLLYISAASDLEGEREILGRVVTELPLTLGWRVVASPIGDNPVDREAVARAGVHLLLLGSDIRAPIGQEWIIARRSGRWPVFLLKQGVLRTSAAQNFVRFIEGQATWQPFDDLAELRLKALRHLADHVLQLDGLYGLSPAEASQLRAWRANLGTSSPIVNETRGGAGAGGVVLSPERYEPSEGFLIRSPGESGARREPSG